MNFAQEGISIQVVDVIQNPDRKVEAAEDSDQTVSKEEEERYKKLLQVKSDGMDVGWGSREEALPSRWSHAVAAILLRRCLPTDGAPGGFF